MHRLPGALVAAIAVLLSSPAHAAVEGEGTSKTITAARAPSAPVIDGDLDEPAWAGAQPDDRFTQYFPDEGKPPTEKTEVRVMFDDDAIYVGVRAHDRKAAEIVGRLTRRDRVVESDAVTIGFDSRHDHSTAYIFQLNASGVQADWLMYNDTNASFEWDAVWDGAVSRDASGWSAEFRIPLSVLRFASAEHHEWGFQVRRYLSRNKESSLWTAKPRTVQGEVSRMGHLAGLDGLRPKRTFELRPFAVSRISARTDSGGALLGMQNGARFTPSFDVGLDVKVGLTTELTLDATVNPDFGQVEADQVVLNLSRFETFFPEKRPFFLEGTEIFQTPIQLFYTRRIGRPPSGLGPGSVVLAKGGLEREVLDAPGALRIWSAAKLTGKAVGPVSVGLLEAVTAREEVRLTGDGGTEFDERLSGERNYAVGRARWDIGGNSYAGAIATAVTRLDGDLYRARANHDDYVGAVDGQWQSHDGGWRLSGMAVASLREGGTAYEDDYGRPCPDPAAGGCYPIVRADGTRIGPGDTGWGVKARGVRRGQHWIGEAEWQSYSPRFDVNGLGFEQGFNRHRFDGWMAYQDASGKGSANYWAFGGGVGAGTTFDGVRTPAEVGFNYERDLKSFWYYNLNLGVGGGGWNVHETGDGARFEDVPGMGGGVFVSSDSRKAVQVRGGVFGGSALSRAEFDVGTNGAVVFRVIPELELELSPAIYVSRNDLRNYFYDPCTDDAGGPCTVDTLSRHYRFAELDSGSISLTLRSTYTFSPRLSLQGYAQLFLSEGAFSRYSRIDTMGEHPTIERDDLVDDPGYDPGPDGDDFESKALNVNLVLRWELHPGSTLLVVYTRAQDADYTLAGAAPRFSLRGLGDGPAEDVFLLKLTLFSG